MSRGDGAYIHEIIRESTRAVESLASLEAELMAAAALLEECLRYGGKVLACGNGGSAADASHFTTELLCRFERDRKSLGAVSLTADGAFLTAAGNDYEFARVFSRQVEGLGRPGDVLVGISTSGQSVNVQQALVTAKDRGLKTLTLLGRDGGGMRGLADVEILIPHRVTARIQEAQKVVIHLLCGLVERALFPG